VFFYYVPRLYAFFTMYPDFIDTLYVKQHVKWQSGVSDYQVLKHHLQKLRIFLASQFSEYCFLSSSNLITRF